MLSSVTAYSFLVNPRAGGAGRGRGRGGGRELAEVIAQILRAGGHAAEVHLSSGVEASAALVAATVARGDVVVSVGGDGTLASLAGLVSRCGGTLGVVPTGRGNDFARMLALPSDAHGLATVLAAGAVRSLDLISCTVGDRPRQLVAGSVYSGVDAIAAEMVERMRWTPRALQYQVAAVRSLASYTPTRVRVSIDGEVLTADAATVVVANSAYYGAGMKIAPDASLTDGLLDVVVIAAGSRGRLIRAMPKVYDGRHVALDEVTVLRGRVIEISGVPSVPMGGDGEPLGRLPGLTDPPARIEVVPGALRVLLPV
ncbi:YegS/Rv2252/BmrU family lipid kinase [Nocardioides cavernaquae]|uniref:YegS/Rv2252/BmrU family lipid kinase n=1 Tax=Nocardioides cavernaquae TaxID=2321396 RepID=A0A3A5H8D6_9ACTN|nr:YegS/Rv2252/BmrU family lipid kinase [Nocardioides cavernaquae]